MAWQTDQDGWPLRQRNHAALVVLNQPPQATPLKKEGLRQRDCALRAEKSTDEVREEAVSSVLKRRKHQEPQST